MEISSIHIYPIKSLGGINLKIAKIEKRGLQYDRRWMLVDPDGQIITQREFPKLALLQPIIEAKTLLIKDKQDTISPLSIPLHPTPSSNSMEVEVWGTKCKGSMSESSIDQWFTDYLDSKCHLVYMSDDFERPTDPKYTPTGQIVSYADAYPFLIIGQSALDHLNEKLDTPIPMDRLRPNFVFTGGTPHFEDCWRDFKIGQSSFRGVKPCGRCNMTTVDQTTGKIGKEPLKTLSTYRRINNKILFGQCLIWMDENMEGTIRIGDKIS